MESHEQLTTLLDLAEYEGLTPPYRCRSGSCEPCSSCVVFGEVVYVEPPMSPPTNIAGEKEMTQALLNRVEKCILDDPGQWCIFRKLSRTDETRES